MDDDVEGAGRARAEPRPWGRRDALTPVERRTVAVAAGGPFLVVLLLLLPLVPLGRAALAEVVAAAAVYGVLLGLASGFVAVDRLQARQCPGCQTRSPRGTSACPSCGYDLAARPRWLCDQRHQLYLDGGLCECGRRLHELPPARGIGREVVVMLRIGAGLLVFLMAVGFLLRAVGP